jgi:hypothetical protein
MHRAGACSSSSGFRHRANRCAENPLGRTRSAGYLDGGNRYAVAAPAKYADQEFFTAAQRVELDIQRGGLAGKDQRAERGTEADVGGSYNQLFVPRKHTGMRTSMIVDPPNGRIPQLTAEAQKIAAAEREFRLALLQSTDTCKNRLPACSRVSCVDGC